MKLGINRTAITRAAKSAAPVIVGAAAARIGGNLARQYVPGVAGFAARGTYHAAAVDAGAGLLLGGLAVPALAKALKAPPAQVAGLTALGVGVVVAGPLVMEQVDNLAASLLSAKPAAGFFSSPSYGGTLGSVIDMPRAAPAGFYGSAKLGGTI